MSEKEKALEFNRAVKAALLTVYTALNSGQQQKLMKDEAVRELFARYGLPEDDT